MKDKIINGNYYQSYDLFDSKINEDLLNSCNIHFTNNLHSIGHRVKITNCILDCHGLHLTQSIMYPYSQNYWNIFCKTVCDKVRDYILLVHPEIYKPRWKYRNILNTGDQVFPHSCWALNVLPIDINHKDIKKPLFEYRKTIDPLWKNDTFITAIFYLQNSNSAKGTILKQNDSKYYISDGAENSLFIFRDCLSKECDYIFTGEQPKTIIKFDFSILGDPHNVPWFSPRVIPRAI